MEEGTKTKKTVFVSGLGDDIDESVIVETFSTFGSLCKEYSLISP
jgi:peptidyl-prolyl isomerase E (cyclophilin E)